MHIYKPTNKNIQQQNILIVHGINNYC